MAALTFPMVACSARIFCASSKKPISLSCASCGRVERLGGFRRRRGTGTGTHPSAEPAAHHRRERIHPGTGTGTHPHPHPSAEPARL